MRVSSDRIFIFLLFGVFLRYPNVGSPSSSPVADSPVLMLV